MSIYVLLTLCLALVAYAAIQHFGLLNGAAITAAVYLLSPKGHG